MNYTIDNRTAQKIYNLAMIFYSDPENVRQFEEWKKERDSVKNEKFKQEVLS